MKAEFVKLTWEKATPPYLVQGVKRHQTPRGAIRGSNGSFLVAGEPPKLYLTVNTEDGNMIRQNVYHDVMNQSGRARMSEKFFECIKAKFEHAEFEVNPNGAISWNCIL